MINESNRNTRTLIVSFVLAIMALVPLRFVEAGQIIEANRGEMVLGDSEEIILPNAEVPMNKVVLEAPYNEIDGKNLK